MPIAKALIASDEKAIPSVLHSKIRKKFPEKRKKIRVNNGDG
jgi:hypothetical protein